MDHRLRLLTAAIFAIGCSSGSDATAPGTVDTFGGSATALSVDVTMPDVVYIPNHIDIARGGVVRFIFASVAHDVRFNGATGAPADVPVTINATVSRTFSATGTFAFLCTLHSNMTGTVVVH